MYCESRLLTALEKSNQVSKPNLSASHVLINLNNVSLLCTANEVCKTIQNSLAEIPTLDGGPGSDIIICRPVKSHAFETILQ